MQKIVDKNGQISYVISEQELAELLVTPLAIYMKEMMKVPITKKAVLEMKEETITSLEYDDLVTALLTDFRTLTS
jgi:hypothetical protein